MPALPADRLPFDPLHHYSAKTIAAASGIPLRTVQRWRVFGVPVMQADRIAVALGFHPIEVWGASYDAWCPL